VHYDKLQEIVVETFIYYCWQMLYIGWSDVTYLWSQYNLYFVEQNIVQCVVKWQRFLALFE